MEYIKAKTIVSNYNKNNDWFGTEYNMNIYKGCSHGCIYCDSRSSCYGIQNFDDIKVKENTLETLRNDLKRKIKLGVIATGSMSDPYNPIEKDLCLTRNALELISAYGFGVSIATKSNLILRDIDILKEISAPVICKITITTADDELSKIIEPHVCVSSERFKIINELAKNDIYAGILMMPILPFITDSEQNIRDIVNLAHKNGAKFIYPSFGVTLRLNQREYFYNMLDKKFVGIRQKYEKNYDNRYYCHSPNVKKLALVFKEECDKYGILYNMKDIIWGYRNHFEKQQLSFF